MPTPANPTALAQQARRSYVERLIGGMPAVVQAVDQGARALAAAVAEPAVALKRRELMPDAAGDAAALAAGHDDAAARLARTGTVAQTRLGELPVLPGQRAGKLSLVDDDTIEHEILSSRLALAMMDRASWEFTDLRSRMNVLERREELETNDVLRAARAGAHRHRFLAGRAARLRRLAGAADGAARRVVALRRRGLPRDQPLAARAQRAAGSRPAAVHPPLQPRRPAADAHRRQRRLRHADRHRAAAAHRLPAVGDRSRPRPRRTRSARRRG